MVWLILAPTVPVGIASGEPGTKFCVTDADAPMVGRCADLASAMFSAVAFTLSNDDRMVGLLRYALVRASRSVSACAIAGTEHITIASAPARTLRKNTITRPPAPAHYARELGRTTFSRKAPLNLTYDSPLALCTGNT